MNRFLAFITKEFRHILRDRRTLMILFGMPVMQVLLFGFVLNNEIKNAHVAVIDASPDQESRLLTQKIFANDIFVPAPKVKTVSELEGAFRRNEISMAMVLPPDFAGKMAREGIVTVQVIGDASDPNTASTLLQYAQSILLGYQRDYNSRYRAAAVAGIQVETRMRYNPEMKSVYNFVPGVMTLILMLVSAMMTSITIAREKEMGTMEVLLVSPLKPIQIILGKTTPYLVLSFINAAMVVVLGIVVFGMPLKGSILLLAMETVLYMFVALSLGIFISTKAKDQMSAMFMSGLGLLMPTMLLSGFIFPIESMPVPLQVLSKVIPATWFNIIVKGVMIKGVGMESLWKHTLVLTGMGVFFLVLSLRNFKDRLA